MMTRRFLSTIAAAAVLAGIAHASDDGGPAHAGLKPPVLQHSEPLDSAVVTLPGPPPEPVAAPAPAAVAAVRLDKAPDEPRPFLHRVKRVYPPGFEEDSAKFLQQQIGRWQEFDVHDLLGKALRQRPAFDDAGKENGFVYAYDDPTGRYKGFELDFAAGTGELRTVFIYPVKMTWQACRQAYGASVTAADAPQGRKFYSYLNRRMDVLVDASGKVISLGFY
jgi:ABC-type amino acid transport substrate-binding protein